MNKLVNKFRKKKNIPPPTRITSETIGQHREHILAGGRKFKYPLQYARHKLVINTIIISLVSILVVLVIGWWQLYLAQNTSEFMYRVTKVVPVPVASVDGQPVLYSDYLMVYRSSVYLSENKQRLNPKTDDGKRQIEYFKQQSIQEAITNAYAIKLANNLDIEVSNEELDSFVKDQRQSSVGEISQQVFDASTLDFLGLTPSEYRHAIKNGLLRQKVAYAIDEDAIKLSDALSDSLVKDSKLDFKKLTESTPKQNNTKAIYGVSGWVPKVNQDGGLAAAAINVQKLEVSPVIKSSRGDGYYIVRLIDISEDEVSYEYIQIPLTTFTNSLEKVIADGKVKKYISIEDIKE